MSIEGWYQLDFIRRVAVEVERDEKVHIVTGRRRVLENLDERRTADLVTVYRTDICVDFVSVNAGGIVQ